MRKRIVTLLMAVLCVCLGVAVFAACAETNGDDNTSYTVTYVGGDGATGTAPTEAAHKKGETFTVAQNTFVKDGFDFKNWSDGDKAYEAGAQYTMPAKNVTFTATWEVSIPEYNITFSLGEGATGTAPETLVKTTGDKITLPQLPTGATKAGYTFKAWSDGTVEYAAGAEYTVGTSAVTFTAVWVPASIEGTWTGSVPSIADITVEYEFSITAAPAAADADYYMVAKMTYKYGGVVKGLGTYYDFEELETVEGQTDVYELEGIGTLKFADNQLVLTAASDPTETAVELTYAYIPNATLSEGKWWATSYYSSPDYSSASLLEAVVTGTTLQMTTTENDPTNYGEWITDSDEGTVVGIGNYIVLMLEESGEIIVAKENGGYTVCGYDIQLNQGNTVSYKVKLDGVEDSERTVWGGLSIGAMDSMLLNTPSPDAAAGQSTDWYDGTTLVDNSYVPTKDVTLTAHYVAERPLAVSFTNNGQGESEQVRLPDVRIKNMMTYDETDKVWKLTLPTPDKLGFEGINGYRFVGWDDNSSDEPIAAGQTVTLAPNSNSFTTVWEFPLLGQWKSGDKTVVILPPQSDQFGVIYPDAAAQIILFDVAATNPTPAMSGRIELTANGYIITGAQGYNAISYADGKITIGTTVYEFETNYEALVDQSHWTFEGYQEGLYECTGKIGLICERNAIYRYENGKVMDDEYAFFGDYGVIFDLALNGLYIAYPSADGLIVADLAAGSYAKYTAPAAITITLDLNGGTAEFWDGDTHNPPYTLETYKGQIVYLDNAIEGIVSKVLADYPDMPFSLIGWATRTGTEGNYVYELVEEQARFYANTTLYAVYGFSVQYDTRGNAPANDLPVNPYPPYNSYVGESLKFTVDAKDLKTYWEGYTFKGWALDKNETDETKLYHYGDVITFTPEQIEDSIASYGKVNLYAIWEITAKPEVTFHKDLFGGTGSDAPDAQISDSINAAGNYTVKLPENTYTKEGAAFRGWLIGSIVYAPGEYYEAKPGDIVEIYAVWEYPEQFMYNAAAMIEEWGTAETKRIALSEGGKIVLTVAYSALGADADGSVNYTGVNVQVFDTLNSYYFLRSDVAGTHVVNGQWGEWNANSGLSVNVNWDLFNATDNRYTPATWNAAKLAGYTEITVSYADGKITVAEVYYKSLDAYPDSDVEYAFTYTIPNVSVPTAYVRFANQKGTQISMAMISADKPSYAPSSTAPIVLGAKDNSTGYSAIPAWVNHINGGEKIVIEGTQTSKGGAIYQQVCGFLYQTTPVNGFCMNHINDEAGIIAELGCESITRTASANWSEALVEEIEANCDIKIEIDYTEWGMLTFTLTMKKGTTEVWTKYTFNGLQGESYYFGLGVDNCCITLNSMTIESMMYY